MRVGIVHSAAVIASSEISLTGYSVQSSGCIFAESYRSSTLKRCNFFLRGVKYGYSKRLLLAPTTAASMWAVNRLNSFHETIHLGKARGRYPVASMDDMALGSASQPQSTGRYL